ncbi:hypothetical protein BH20ACI1_BH20ACI1_14230 [soil metagenome]
MSDLSNTFCASFSQLVRVRVLLAALAFLFCLSATENTFAANFIVTRTDDRNTTCNSGVDCSLREAVNAANAAATNDTITFAAGLTTITLTNEIIINNNGTLTITGNGANVFTIDGGAGTNRIFTNLATTIISGATLTGGNGMGANFPNFIGGAIFTGNSLTLDSVHITGNSSSSSSGGGVYFGGGTHSIINSTISGNTANNCGGFNTESDITVVNSTISGNTVPNSGNVGGGFCSQRGTTTLRNVTITNNTAGSGGGINIDFGATLNFGNTIVAGNTATGGSGAEIRFGTGTITSAGYNLVGDSAGDSTNTGNAITYQPTDILDINPMLGALTITNGGTTPTHALQTGSPAIDKGNSFGLTTDQRGFARPFDNPSITNATGGDGADIGAFEVQAAPTAASVSIGGRVMTASGRGIRNVYITLTDSNGNNRLAVSTAFGYYRFEDVAAGETYIISASAKQYTFSQPTQVLNINEDADGINFIANSIKTVRGGRK